MTSSKFHVLDPLAGSINRTVQAKLSDVISPEDFGAVGDGRDDTAALQNAIEYCLENNVQHLISSKTFSVASPLYISNFSFGFNLQFGLKAHANFPAIPSSAGGWRSAQPLICVGATGGGIVGLNIHLTYADGAGKADIIYITNNGCGGSVFQLDYVANANIIVKLANNTAPTASNFFKGGYWRDSTLAGLVVGGSTVCEGTIFDVGFITTCKYGGLLFGDKSQYANVRGQLDFNGMWLTEMQVTNPAGFTVGQQLNNGSGSTAELMAIYLYQGVNYFLVAETKSTTDGATNFSVNNNFTNGTAVTAIQSIRTTNQNGDNRFFDIIAGVSASAPFWRARIDCAYLGGIVGNHLWNSVIFSGNSAVATTNSIQGLEVYNSGTTLSLADKRGSDASFMDVTDQLIGLKRQLYMGSNPVYGFSTSQTIQNGATLAFLTLPAGATGTGSVWQVYAVGTADAALRASGKVFLSAGSSTGKLDVDTLGQQLLSLTLVGNTLYLTQGTGADRPVYMAVTRVL